MIHPALASAAALLSRLIVLAGAAVMLAAFARRR